MGMMTAINLPVRTMNDLLGTDTKKQHYIKYIIRGGDIWTRRLLALKKIAPERTSGFAQEQLDSIGDPKPWMVGYQKRWWFWPRVPWEKIIKQTNVAEAQPPLHSQPSHMMSDVAGNMQVGEGWGFCIRNQAKHHHPCNPWGT